MSLPRANQRRLLLSDIGAALVGTALLGTASVHIATATTAAECRVIALDAARLACYDRLYPPSAATPAAPAAASGSARAATPPPTSAAPASVSPATTSTEAAVSQFGLSETKQRAALGAAALPKSISGSIKSLQQGPAGRWIAQLDNGQFWQSTEVDAAGTPQVGDRVTIRRGALGSYLLATSDHLSTHVRRVK
jgi:hypothetical protein